MWEFLNKHFRFIVFVGILLAAYITGHLPWGTIMHWVDLLINKVGTI